MFALIANIFKVLLFFIDLWKEREKELSEKKADVAKEVVDAFKQTDPKLRASMLNAAITSIKLVRQ